jgi:hypothetical protein
MIDLRLGDYRETLGDVTCDLLCVDAPYSARTHGGHDGAATVGTHGHHRSGHGLSGSGFPVDRRAIDYHGWTPADVREFVDFFASRTRGWMVSITDHVLAPVWAEAMESTGRYVFAPIPWVAPGSRVRLAGDGPSSWACWIIVGRPRTGEDRNGRPFSKWGTLPGAYVVTQERGIVVGNKPLALMAQLVDDYSRPGDTVCDPCAGGGTTLLAARKLGRDAIGSELDPETHHKASMRLGLVEDVEGLPLFGTKDLRA